ncbi:hypothetical protein [Actinomycetospora sp. NBRC 106378]|uniref:hypothetical protein n=1 Tax=Actinomycetospora sp. NBRC 106378 TaxID=3032208 RepID=UPI0024A19E6B|nr:hypothetical protein [Actinomycetospora sp. NBRC 106378]GLZ53528.1 molybdopterin-binding oxidoreductase [Actinomycetospora sp. NBRC 106378]
MITPFPSLSTPARAVGAVALLVLLTACGAPAAPAAPAPTSASADVPAGAVRVTGAVRDPQRVLTAQDLAAAPQRDVTVSFQSSRGAESHQERGVALDTLLPPQSLATDPAAKNDQLRFAVLALGADGYAATVAYGEVSPDFGNRGLLVSLTEDGKPLTRPRLVVPGDVKGGRYVSDLVELRVVRVS